MFVNGIMIKEEKNINMEVILLFFIESKNTREINNSHEEFKLHDIKFHFPDFFKNIYVQFI